jgi:hypothetical protein
MEEEKAKELAETFNEYGIDDKEGEKLLTNMFEIDVILDSKGMDKKEKMELFETFVEIGSIGLAGQYVK